MENSEPKVSVLEERNQSRPNGQAYLLSLTSSLVTTTRFLQEEAFHNMLTLERRRAERSRKPFVLMLLDARTFVDAGIAESIMPQVTSAVFGSTRETDLIGWYKQGVILAVIFTEISLESTTPITDILRLKVVGALDKKLGREVSSNVRVSVHLFPEIGDREGAGPIGDVRLYPELSGESAKKRFPLVAKRIIDIMGSGLLLLILSPLLAVIALAIKLTSKGPIIFRQSRLGQFGTKFDFLKFRTMQANNDPKIHQEYIRKYIAGQAGTENSDAGQKVVYKLTNDPRVTKIGRFLRKTSLDELPQFWNVLRGEMSLVGPRPPVPYEFESYDTWHRRRVLEMKPGITGLWQVTGRSRTSFDDMVRLDLRYSQRWSLWLDLKILWATPRAVLTADGAY